MNLDILCLFQNKNMANKNKIEAFLVQNSVFEDDKVVPFNISFYSTF